MINLLAILLGIPAIMVATTIHEFTRAAVSTALGDKIPKEEGRLTLNPIKHFEPIGLIIMLACGFGWAKPVNTSSLSYKNRKQGVLLTAILPTVANLVLAIVALIIARLVGNAGVLALFFTRIAYFSCCLVIYNLIPVSPMDCLKVLSVVLPANTYFKFVQYEKIIQMAFLFVLFLGLGNVISGIAGGLYYLIAAFMY